MYDDDIRTQIAEKAYAQSLGKVSDTIRPTLGSALSYTTNIRDRLASAVDQLDILANAIFGEEPPGPSTGSKPEPYYAGAIGDLQERLDRLMELACRLERLAQRLSTVL